MEGRREHKINTEGRKYKTPVRGPGKEGNHSHGKPAGEITPDRRWGNIFPRIRCRGKNIETNFKEGNFKFRIIEQSSD